MAQSSGGGWFRNKSTPKTAPLRILTARSHHFNLRIPSQLQAITAAATEIDVGDRAGARRQRALRQGWQGDAWSYRDAIGELRYAIQFLANCTARMRYFPAAYPTGGESDNPVPLAEIKGAPPSLLAAANQAMTDLGHGRLAIAHLAESLSTNISVAGECYMLGRQDPQTGQENWSIRSIDEIVVQDDHYKLREIPSDPQGIVPWIELDPDTTYLDRIWIPHPRFHLLGDSPLRAMLEECEALLILRRMIRAAGRSRLAGAGLLLLPDEVSIKVPIDDDEDPQADPFFDALATAMMEPIADEGVASAVVPIVARMPGEYLKDVQHINFGQQFGEMDQKVRDELVGVIATTFDLPKEVIVGVSDLNHWSAWQVDDSTFRHHVEPHVIKCCDALTGGFLRSYLEQAGEDPYWVQRVVMWYDPTELVTHPDRSKDAKDLYGDMALSAEAYRREAGFEEKDAPTIEELEARRIWDIRALPLNLLMELARRADPTLVVPPITVSGTVPGIKVGGVDVGALPPAPAAPAPPAPGGPPAGAKPAEPAPAGPPPNDGPPKPQPPAVTGSGAEPNTGAMVALYLPPELAAKWALPGGEAPEELHITLAFLGQSADIADPGALGAAVGEWAKQTTPISGEISGVGLFTAGEDPVTYLSPDLPSLPDARQQLVDALASAGADHSQEHGFTPHITLDYADRIGEVDPTVGGTEITFDSVAVVLGEERTDYPLGQALVASAAQAHRLSEKLAMLDRELRTRLQVAANAAMLRQLERIGNRLRSKVARDETLRNRIAHTRSERVSAVLGKDVVTAAGVNLDVLGDWTGLHAQFDEWVAAAQRQALALAARIARLPDDHPSLAESEASMHAARANAWDTLHGALSSSAERLLYSPDPNTAAGDFGELSPDALVPTGTIRSALAIAGGAAPDSVTVDEGGALSLAMPAGQIGTGDIISGLLSDAGGEQAQWVFNHGPALVPFGPHEDLDGVEFANFDDEVLANPGDWPPVAFLFAGDHDSCSCDVMPLWDFPGNPLNDSES